MCTVGNHQPTTFVFSCPPEVTRLLRNPPPPPSRGRIGGCGPPDLTITITSLPHSAITAQAKTDQDRCVAGFATTLHSTLARLPTARHNTLDTSCNHALPPLRTSPSTKSQPDRSSQSSWLLESPYRCLSSFLMDP